MSDINNTNTPRSKLIAIVGPTASGKSSIGIEVAKRFGGEIINADSRQIYKGLDIGSAKDPKDDAASLEYKVSGVIHHLIDFVDPGETLNVAQFKNLANKKIIEINGRNKLPVLVGGTGLWIDAVCSPQYDFEKTSDSDPSKKTFMQLSRDELFDKIYSIDEKILYQLNESDLLNPRRLARALEKISGNETEKISGEKQQRTATYDVLYLSPKIDLATLGKKIYARVEKMFEQGLLAENTKLNDMNLDTNLPSMSAIGYKEFQPFFRGEATLDEVKEEIKLRTRQYAKRQITWFKRNKDIHYVEDAKEAIRLVDEFLNQRS